MPTTLTNHGGHGIALSELVRVQRRFLRSVNLERDFYTTDPLEGYVLTPSVLLALERVAAAVEHPYARAISLTGAYGSGKSAFALFTAKVLAGNVSGTRAPTERLMNQDPSLADRLVGRQSEWWPILISGVRAPIGRVLADGLLGALERIVNPAARAVARQLRRKARLTPPDQVPTAREVVALYETAAALARAKCPSFGGLLVVIDEAGKFLEYAALQPKRGDMQVLQELAELAARSKDNPLLLITILHQAFDDYAHRLGPVQRTEWQKVHGRFIDVPFGDSPEETMRLIGQAITQQELPGVDERLAPLLSAQMQWCEALRTFPPFLSAGEYKDVLRRTYPLHPLALRTVPYLFRRFGQNERSLFTFLSSEEPFGFQEFLREHNLGSGPTPILKVHHLYDYVVATLGSTLYAHPTAKLWSEAEEALFRLRDREVLLSQLVKTIAVLHILGEQTRLLPSKDMLVFALEDESVDRAKIEAAVDELEATTVITYRQFRKAYRLYEGSDIDVDARLRDAHVYFAHGTDVIAVARALESMSPIVARRHSYERGTLRIFEVRYCRPTALEIELEQPHGEQDGLVLICLAADGGEQQAIAERVPELLSGRPEVIVGVCLESDTLHEAAVAVESLLWVKENTPELRNDRVATREVDERLVDARVTFLAEWERLLRPKEYEDTPSYWYYSGDRIELQSHRELQELVSTACDRAFPHAPRILNELVNRRQLSSVAAAARRNLIEAMLSRQTEVNLGIDGFPPERSMYASLLASTGIHRQITEEVWGVRPPSEDADEGLRRVWTAIDTWLFGGDLQPKPVTDLYLLLRSRPFGLAEGVIPVLLCAVLLYRNAEVGVYEEGRFITDLDIATFERLIKRPEDYSLQGCRIAGERQTALDRFARGLLRPGDAPTIVNVARRIYRAFRALPDYTLRTKLLSERARSLRDLLRGSTEPEQLLFLDLPRCLGAEPFREDDSEGDNTELFFAQWNETFTELVGAYPALLDRMEAELCSVFEVEDWTALRHRAAVILPYVSAPSLSSFALRAADEMLDRSAWLASVGTVVVNRPPSNWSDIDEQLFGHEIAALASPFSSALALAFAKKQQVGREDQFALRIAIASDTGAEDAAVVLAPRAQGQQVDELARLVTDAIRETVRCAPREIQMAAIAKAMQELLRRGEEEESSDD